MANWSDQRPGVAPLTGAATDARGVAYDAGLRSFMLGVYNYMASAVLLSGVVALLFSMGGRESLAAQVFIGGGILKWVITFAPLAFILFMNFKQMSAGALQATFWGFAVVMGLSLSTIFLVYQPMAIASAFFASAAGFAGLSLWGYTTERNLSAMGSFLLVGLVGLIVASLLNLFLHSGPLGLMISLVGVLIFAGLTAYDTQRTKSIYAYVAGTSEEGRAQIMSATSLYLDFVNMFMFLLRLFGSSRN
ncbi:MAG: Bax inhibitor-1/YccA family protein [Sphingomonas sp.]|uniref:Bax inhibitor-1/YccA family protein n=1 Tax=Sphingomonas sp. TaxID=28214 RepID=UPI001AC6A446|nr:Bax inhibitor-1/YccA family protein [Sphingomonas sp.]MBN8806949.1 Bax inhibitor-1/YccA family protein [Sphingomonas sp.]